MPLVGKVILLIVITGSFVASFLWGEVHIVFTEEGGDTAVNALPEPRGPFSVTRIIDGDTIVLTIEGKSESVRLIGIDAPEINFDTNIPECYAWEARDRVLDLLKKRTVLFQEDKTQDERDAYGRLLGYVYTEAGENVSLVLLTEGYAREYTHIVPYALQTEFRMAALHAEASHRGVWDEETCPTVE